MKKIYVSHSKDIDYNKKIYDPLGKIKGVNFIFPYLKGKTNFSKEIIKKCDYFLADISKPAMGMGIETGWANAFGVPIILIYKKGSKVSSYLSKLSKNIIEYKNLDKELNKIEKIIIKK